MKSTSCCVAGTVAAGKVSNFFGCAVTTAIVRMRLLFSTSSGLVKFGGLTSLPMEQGRLLESDRDRMVDYRGIMGGLTSWLHYTLV
jgi:hypothetical protein